MSWGSWSNWKTDWSWKFMYSPWPDFYIYRYSVRYRQWSNDRYFPGSPLRRVNVLCSMGSYSLAMNETVSVKVSGSIGGESSGVSASLGFEVSQSLSLTDTLVFNPQNCMNVEYSIYVRYTMYQVQIYAPDRSNTWSTRTATVHKPIGFYSVAKPTRSPYCCSARTKSAKTALRGTGMERGAEGKRLAHKALSGAVVALMSRNADDAMVWWRRAAIALSGVVREDPAVAEVISEVYSMELALNQALVPTTFSLSESHPELASMVSARREDLDAVNSRVEGLLSEGRFADAPAALDRLYDARLALVEAIGGLVEPEEPEAEVAQESVILNAEQRENLHESIRDLTEGLDSCGWDTFIESLSPVVKPALGLIEEEEWLSAGLLDLEGMPEEDEGFDVEGEPAVPAGGPPGPLVTPARDFDDLKRIEGVDAVLERRLREAGIRTLSDLAERDKVRRADKIEGISARRLNEFHEMAKMGVDYPNLSDNEMEVAVRGLGLRSPVQRSQVENLLEAGDESLEKLLARVRLPSGFGITEARALLRKLLR